MGIKGNKIKHIKTIFRNRFLLLLSFSCFAFLQTTASFAESNLEIEPYYLQQDELSKPGFTINLRAQVYNSSDLNIPMKALVNIDDQLTVALPYRVHINSNDLPQYLFNVPAPVTKISYQFVLFPPNEPAVFSNKVTLTRDCIIPTTVAQKTDKEPTGKELYVSLLAEAEALDYEARLYIEATKKLEEIKELTNKIIEKIERGKSK